MSPILSLLIFLVFGFGCTRHTNPDHAPRQKIKFDLDWKFTKGDFLSVHNDTNLGRYAFIIYLNEKWNRRCGGDLNIITKYGIHIPIYPEYNKLILMDIKSSDKPHYINEVKCDNRYAITGWFL